MSCERLAGGQWKVKQELGGSGTGYILFNIVDIFHHYASDGEKTFQNSGIRQTMWQRGGRCSGVKSVSTSCHRFVTILS